MDYDKFLKNLENRGKTFFNFCERHFSLIVIVLFLLSLGIRLFFTPFDTVLRKDAFIYVTKSLEVLRGNFSPILVHTMGWPLFMSPFLLLGGGTILESMLFARLVSDFLGALTIFPLALLGRKFLDKKHVIILLTLFAFSSHLVLTSTMAISESLFIPLLIVSVYLITKSTENQNYILLASVVGALSYYVRQTGLFILLIILISFFMMRKQVPKFNYKHFLYIIAIFFIISTPLLFNRAVHFGSPFFYGPTSKYFVDNYEQVWAFNVPAPSLMDYLATHTFTDYIDKFVIHGFLSILKDYFFYVISPLLLFFFCYGIIKYLKDRKLVPVFVTLFIWVISYIPVYAIYDTPRYFYSAIPFIFIISVMGVREFLGKEKHQNTAISLFMIIFVLFSLLTISQQMYRLSNEPIDDGLEWGAWIASNIDGKLAIIDGDLVMMHLPDTTVSGHVDLYAVAPVSNLSVTKPGYFSNLNEAMVWYKENGVTHLAVSQYDANRKPFLREIGYKENSEYFIPVYSNYDTDSNWKMRVYEINWSGFYL